MADYNWEMTGPPDAVTIATDPEAVADWNRYVARTTVDYSPAQASSPIAPQAIANPVYEDKTYWNSGKVAYQTGGGETAYAPAFLRPQEYVSNELAAPYSKAELNALVDPKNIRLGYGNTPYAGIRGGAGGEYVVDPKTNRFLLDKSGNPIPVPQEPYKQSGFDTLMTNYVIPAMLAAGAIGTGLGAAGLIGEGALAAGAAEGGGASGFGGLTGNSGYASTGMLGGATGGAGGISIPTTGGALGLNAGLEASIAAGAGVGLPAAGTSATGAAIGQSLGGVGGLNAALPAVGAGEFGSMSAALAPNTVLGTGLAGGGAIGGSYLLGANGLPATNIFGTPITASSVGIGGYPASPSILDTLSSAASALSPTSALTTAALGSTALKAITGTPTATPTPTTAGTPSTYAPRGQVGYDPLLSLLAPRLITRNQYSLLG